jgi:hypothetical protein
VELFLGFSVDESFSKALSSIDPQVKNLFIRSDTHDYLQEVAYNDRRYIGKFVGEITDSKQLKLIESNIYSLLKKIIPDYPSEQVSLQVFPVQSPQT